MMVVMLRLRDVIEIDEALYHTVRVDVASRGGENDVSAFPRRRECCVAAHFV